MGRLYVGRGGYQCSTAYSTRVYSKSKSCASTARKSTIVRSGTATSTKNVVICVGEQNPTPAYLPALHISIITPVPILHDGSQIRNNPGFKQGNRLIHYLQPLWKILFNNWTHLVPVLRLRVWTLRTGRTTQRQLMLLGGRESKSRDRIYGLIRVK